MKPNASIAIITGLSGAGKSHALKTLEDLGYFCVDNLPPSLIPKFLELCSQGVEPKEKIALVVDIRGGEFFQDLTDALAEIKAQGINPLILFLEADDNTLIKRYSSHGEGTPCLIREASWKPSRKNATAFNLSGNKLLP